MAVTALKHRYEVQENIGEGNLFTVYRAEDRIDNRPVAVKVLLPQYAANRLFAERLLVEAHAMLGVSHPSIVEVYDCGEENSTYFVVLEYIRGVDLKERVRRSAPFTPPTAVDVGIAVCDALDFAHRQGFVHGDLRPGNILVTPEGCIKLTDFWVSDAVASSPSIRTSGMMRSVHYMSPEVAEGEPASPRSDVYSLGVILFEILTGSLPFDGNTAISIALKHARDPAPSCRTVNPSIPKPLEAVAAKALQKSPQSRFRSAKAMLNEMKSVREELNAAKPMTQSPVTEKTVPVPLPEPTETQELDEPEPVLLTALVKALAVTVGIIGVLVAAVATWVWMNPSEVTVPDVVGKELSAATGLARAHDVHLVVKAEEFNEKHKKGVIYLCNPRPGTHIKAGKSVDVWVSKGSKYTRTPKVANLPEEAACRRVLDAGLVVGELSQDYSDTVEAGKVIEQSPPPHTRQGRGEPVNLLVSLGPEPPAEIDAGPEAGGYVGEPRTFDVKFVVPKGREDQIVQIVVVDDYGDNIVYSDVGHPGDTVEQTIQGFGDKITIRIYIDDKLVKEHRQWR